MNGTNRTPIALAAIAIAAAMGGGLVSHAFAGGDGGSNDIAPVVMGTGPTQAVPAPVARGAQRQQRATAAVQAPAVDADDVPISRSEADRVADAALRITGGGTVTDLGRSDDPGEAWEIEVIRNDGVEIDIALDANLNRVQNASYED